MICVPAAGWMNVMLTGALVAKLPAASVATAMSCRASGKFLASVAEYGADVSSLNNSPLAKNCTLVTAAAPVATVADKSTVTGIVKLAPSAGLANSTASTGGANTVIATGAEVTDPLPLIVATAESRCAPDGGPLQLNP